MRDCVDAILTQIKDWSKNLQKYYNRLQIVRKNKMKQLNAWIEHDDNADLRDIAQSEMSSEASTTSNISRLSKISSATTRKRKQV